MMKPIFIFCSIVFSILQSSNFLFVLAFTTNIIDSASDNVEFTLKIKGAEYIISFPPTYDDAVIMTEKFCKEKGHLFGIDSQNYGVACLKPIGDYLREKVRTVLEERKKKNSIKKTGDSRKSGGNVMVDLKIGGSDFQISINPDDNNLSTSAESFCVKNAEKFQISLSNLNLCTGPVLSQLQHVADKIRAEKSLKRKMGSFNNLNNDDFLSKSEENKQAWSRKMANDAKYSNLQKTNEL